MANESITPLTDPRLITIAGKTLTIDNTLELAGTDSTKMTFPSASDTVVTLAATQTLTNKTINGSQLVNTSVAADKLNTGAATSEVATSETTASTSFADLATVQSVTVTVGANGLLLVGFGAQMSATTSQYCAPALSGGNTYAAATADAAFVTSNASVGRVKLFTGLSAGSTTVTLKFKVDAGTGTFLRRNLWAVPL